MTKPAAATTLVPSAYRPGAPGKRGIVPGSNLPLTTGYDATSQANFGNADEFGSSGMFQRGPGGPLINLWITSITADFAVSGTVGQSRMLREWFSKSMNDVTLQITGNVSSTTEYNRLALFVREHQWLAMAASSGGTNLSSGTESALISFSLSNSYGAGAGSGIVGSDQTWPTPTTRGTDVTGPGLGIFGSSGASVKGPHRPWNVTGYITSMAAGATAHDTAPEFNIGFIVAQSQFDGMTGLWGDTLDNGGPQYKTFLQYVGLAQAKGDYLTTPVTSTPALPKVVPIVPIPQGPLSAQSPWSVGAAGTLTYGGYTLTTPRPF